MTPWSKLTHKGVSFLSLEACKQRLYVHNGQNMTGTAQPFSLQSAFTDTPPVILTAASERQVPSVSLFLQDKLKKEEGRAVKELFTVVRIE